MPKSFRTFRDDWERDEWGENEEPYSRKKDRRMKSRRKQVREKIQEKFAPINGNISNSDE